MNKTKSKVTRRSFVEQTALGATALMLGSSTRSARVMAFGSNDRVNVGVIGAGAQGHSLLRNLATVADARIVAICEIFEPNLKKGVELAGNQPKTLDDYRKLIDSRDIDAVLIATPLHLHADVALRALAAGKHVFLEKTLAYSISQCEQLVRAAKASPKLVFQVGHQHRHDPVIRKVYEMVRAGALGKVTHIRCAWHRNGNWRRPVPAVNFDPRPWGYPDLEHLINWRMYKRYSGGLMAELGSHMIEICNLMLGEIPSTVTGSGGIDYWKDGRETWDNVTALYSYPGGAKVIFSSITTNAHFGEQIQIMGTEGTVEMGWNQAFYYREKESPELVKADGATVITSTGETMKDAQKAQKATEVNPEGQQKPSAIYRELESFVSCIRKGSKPDVDVVTGRNAAVSILRANEAIAQGRVVRIG